MIGKPGRAYFLLPSLWVLVRVFKADLPGVTETSQDAASAMRKDLPSGARRHPAG